MERSSSVIDLPLRSGILTFSGRYLAAGSSRATSPRFIMSANTSEVKTFVMDDFEDRLVDLAWIVFGEVAMGDDAASGRFDDSHDNADRLLLLIDTFSENLADVVIARDGKYLKNIRIHKFGNRLNTASSRKTQGHSRRHWLWCRTLSKGLTLARISESRQPREARRTSLYSAD